MKIVWRYVHVWQVKSLRRYSLRRPFFNNFKTSLVEPFFIEAESCGLQLCKIILEQLLSKEAYFIESCNKSLSLKR